MKKVFTWIGISSFILLIGKAGALELGTIGMKQAILQIVLLSLALAASAYVCKHSRKESKVKAVRKIEIL